MSRNNVAVKFSHLKTRKHLCKEIRQINADVNQPSSPSWKNQDEIMSCFPSSLPKCFLVFHVREPTVPEIPLRALLRILGTTSKEVSSSGSFLRPREKGAPPALKRCDIPYFHQRPLKSGPEFPGIVSQVTGQPGCPIPLLVPGLRLTHKEYETNSVLYLLNRSG